MLCWIVYSGTFRYGGQSLHHRGRPGKAPVSSSGYINHGSVRQPQRRQAAGWPRGERRLKLTTPNVERSRNSRGPVGPGWNEAVRPDRDIFFRHVKGLYGIKSSFMSRFESSVKKNVCCRKSWKSNKHECSFFFLFCFVFQITVIIILYAKQNRSLTKLDHYVTRNSGF